MRARQSGTTVLSGAHHNFSSLLIMPLILILTNTGNARLLSNIHPTPRFLPLLSTCVFLSLLGALAAVSVNDVSAGNQNDVPSECQARCVVADTLTDEVRSCYSTDKSMPVY